MHKRVRPGLKLDLVEVGFSLVKKVLFSLYILSYFAFGSSKVATYFLKKLRVKDCM